VKITTITCAFVAAGTIGFLGAPIALADGPTTATIGSPGKLVDAAGNIVQEWTITGLKTSTDVIPYPVAGTLWEATATDEAVQGGVTPIVSNFNARGGDGENYRALFGVATPQGVNPATLAEGQKTTGKVYFDVTGAAPVAVVYNAGGQDLLVWAQAPTPAPRRSGGPSNTAGTPATAPLGEVSALPAGAPTEATTLPPGSVGTPAPAGSQGTPLPTGSQGTPLPTGSQGTPLPAGSQGTPVPAASEGTPLPASQGTPVQAPATSEGTPVVVPPSSGAQPKSIGPGTS
jgi:hypothetical protein